MASGAEPHQHGLSVRQVEGGFQWCEEAGGDDVFVDEVGEADHPVFPSWRNM